MKIGIFIFKNVEILDFTGPYEVFSSVRKTTKILSKKNINEIYKKSSPFKVFTISSKNKNIITSGGLRVICDYTFLDAPNFDILLVPGGKGTRKLITNKQLILAQKTKNQTNNVSLHWSLLLGAWLRKIKKLQTLERPSTFEKNKPFDFNSKKDMLLIRFFLFWSCSGIDLSLKVVEFFYGKTVAKNTAKYMEYNLLKK